MSNIVILPGKVKEYRKNCKYINKGIQIRDEEGELKKYPCICLCEVVGKKKDEVIPIYYTGLERYLTSLVKSENMEESTLAKRAYAVCRFLNFLLYETDINEIHKCTLTVYRRFLEKLRLKDDGTGLNKQTWERYRDYVVDFLIEYYNDNKDLLPFMYQKEHLREDILIKDEGCHRRVKHKNIGSFGIKKPQRTRKKNRTMADGHEKIFLDKIRINAFNVLLGAAMGLYGGVREGEVVNVSCGDIEVVRGPFNAIRDIKINIRPAPFFKGWNKKTNPGEVKVVRTQQIYPDFLNDFKSILDEHMLYMRSRGYDTSDSAPLFVNERGGPMTVQTYSGIIKNVFYKYFVPDVIAECKRQGTYAIYAPYIELYQEDYIGAHAFRHWFTMYLYVKKGIKTDLVSEWRGDVSKVSFLDYIHENREMIHMFEEVTYTLQKIIIEDANERYKLRKNDNT